MKEPFFPKGAIASFVAMIAAYAVIWFVVYSIMVSRG